jgi:hypothetical protein
MKDAPIWVSDCASPTVLTKYRGCFVQLLPSLVVPQREAVGEGEAAQRFRPFEDASALGCQVERLLEEPQSQGTVTGAEGGGRARQQIVERVA